MDWGAIAQVGGSVLNSLLADDGGDDGDRNSTSSALVQPKTVSGGKMQDFDILYSQQAITGLEDFTKKIDQWSTDDRDFFQNTYQPYQDSIMQTNESLLPAIEKVAGQTLEANARDMQSNEGIKTLLRNQQSQAGGVASDSLSRFATELDNIPSVEERVGQALTRVEGQFGQAGKQLSRDFQSRGQTVSQSSKRNLAIEKAKAKSGAAGAAAEAARNERLNAAERGVGVAAQAQIGATGQLTDLQQSQQSGLATPQVGGVVEADSGLGAANLEGQTQATLATQDFGSRTRADDITHTQKGIAGPVMGSGATGQAPAGSATPTGDAGVVGSPGTPATNGTGALIKAGSAGATMSGARDIGSGLMGSLKKVTSGIANPR